MPTDTDASTRTAIPGPTAPTELVGKNASGYAELRAVRVRGHR
ncbi:hypothetical protein [Streptomyces sp. URMC 125]